MEYSSAGFLFIFLPVVFVLYFAVPVRQVRRWLLISASLLFYAFGNVYHLPLLLFSAVSNYLLALWMDKKRGGARKAVLAAAVVLDVAVLAAFKYTGYFVSVFNSVFRAGISVPEIDCPLGISFFTFQILSYIIDSYRGEAATAKSFPKFLLYVSFFAQIAQGPIIRWNDIERELDEPDVSIRNAAEGLRLFIIGLAMKLVIADTLASVTSFVWGLEAGKLNALYSWTGAFAFMLRLYFDFAGYSVMAVGLGRMFGFTIPNNFDHPYISASMTEFWRRWHITLSRWFRDYVYIPLGGSRKGFLRTGLNKIAVFLLTGLWHGPNLTFVVWGAYNGVFLLGESLLKRTKLRLPKLITWAFTMLAVAVGFAIFNSPDLAYAWAMIKSMFTRFDIGGGTAAALSAVFRPTVLAVMLVAVPASFPFPAGLLSRLEKKPVLYNVLKYSSAAALLVLSLFFLASGSYHPSIYVRF